MKATLGLGLVLVALTASGNGLAAETSSSFDIKPEMTPASPEGPLGMQDVPQGYQQESGIEMGIPRPTPDEKNPSVSQDPSQNYSMNEPNKGIDLPAGQPLERDFNPNEMKGAKQPEAGKELGMNGFESGLPDDLKPDHLERELAQQDKGNGVGGIDPSKEDLKKEFAESNVGGYVRETTPEDAEKFASKGDSKREEIEKMFG